MDKDNSKKKVVIYCRESRDDYGENYERIETQRDLLVKYCRAKGYKNIVDIIMDDDKSGTDFSRFDDIKKRARNKQIDVIVFKNSARLGRNQRESLGLVEYLEELGVEIVFEDEQYDEEMFGLYAWFNERRARDDSKNIRRNLKHKIEEGNLIIKAVYGYNKEGKSLKINPETAVIVKEIFELYAKNWGYKKIAEYLNSRGVPTPSQARNFANAKQTTNWNIQHIARILCDRRYRGDYIGGRTEKISFKSKKTRIKSKEEWIIIENHHEAIVDKVLFERVQKIREDRKKQNNKYNSGFKFINAENNMYSGLLYCGRCGMAMYKRKGTSGVRKRPDCYLCKKYSNEGSIKDGAVLDWGCTSHRIRVDFLDKIIAGYINNLVSNSNFKIFFENNTETNMSKITMENNFKNSKDKLAKYEKQYKQIYEDKLDELIPEFLFREKKYELDNKIKCEQEKIAHFLKNISVLEKKKNREEYVSKVIEDIKKNGLTKEELSRLFDRIIVFAPQEITKEQKLLYNLSDMMYNQLYENGGVAFHVKFMYP